jgi:hypothetical protein
MVQKALVRFHVPHSQNRTAALGSPDKLMHVNKPLYRRFL